ncbi:MULTISPECIES: PspA/IM30 family protein [Pseudomonas syringae group]|uniref:Phage shock protein A (PspA) family protein n=2 Tax=Pseudomonas syringae group TaxID=136849 RepID=A0ABX6HGY4_9PSED|nr:PspA/IM30 family protein [Pseudomonas asturiensis]QHF04865.1 hypothetical protein N015_21640 [Pseudomonas asturiensis]
MARIWTKIVTALRGGASEAAGVIMARQALHILDQEIHSAQERLDVSRSSLAGLMAKNLHAKRQLTQNQARVELLTRDAERALQRQDESAALDIAARIGHLERLMVEDARIAQGYATAVSSLSAGLRVSEQKLLALRQQVEVVRTTERVQQAQGIWSASCGDSADRLRKATDGLNDIRQRQLETEARLEVHEASSLADIDLEQRLRDARIIVDSSSAHAVLQRIKSNSPHQSA